MDKFDLDMVDSLIQAVKACASGQKKACDDCPYRTFEFECIPARNRDLIFILDKVRDLIQENKDLQLYALKTTLNRIYGWPDDYKTAPIPENIEKMLEENVQAWKDWTTELREARLQGLRQELEQRQQELKIGGWNNEFHKPEGFQGTSGSN